MTAAVKPASLLASCIDSGTTVLLGRPAVYPYHQKPTRGAWLEQVLGAPLPSGVAVADAIGERGLSLRCEPGRALLDGCGMTAARVAFRKRRHDGTWLVGVQMNRTQCRSTSEDFLVDPLLLMPERTGETSDDGPPTRPRSRATSSARTASSASC